MDMGFNSRIPSVNKFSDAKDALRDAQRDYNRVSKLSSSSGEVRAEKSDAQKKLKQAQRDYDKLRQELIDDINEQDVVDKLKNLQFK